MFGGDLEAEIQAIVWRSWKMSWSSSVYFPPSGAGIHRESPISVHTVLMGKTGPSDFSTSLEKDLYLDFQTTYERTSNKVYFEASTVISTHIKMILNLSWKSCQKYDFLNAYFLVSLYIQMKQNFWNQTPIESRMIDYLMLLNIIWYFINYFKFGMCDTRPPQTNSVYSHQTISALKKWRRRHRRRVSVKNTSSTKQRKTNVWIVSKTSWLSRLNCVLCKTQDMILCKIWQKYVFMQWHFHFARHVFWSQFWDLGVFSLHMSCIETAHVP